VVHAYDVAGCVMYLEVSSPFFLYVSWKESTIEGGTVCQWWRGDLGTIFIYALV
jgi:hypothetical protein